jgi:hypothetical protein
MALHKNEPVIVKYTQVGILVRERPSLQQADGTIHEENANQRIQTMKPEGPYTQIHWKLADLYMYTKI